MATINQGSNAVVTIPANQKCVVTTNGAAEIDVMRGATVTQTINLANADNRYEFKEVEFSRSITIYANVGTVSYDVLGLGSNPIEQIMTATQSALPDIVGAVLINSEGKPIGADGLEIFKRNIASESRDIGTNEDNYAVIVNDSTADYTFTIIAGEQLDYVEFFQDNTGTITLVAGSGVTLNGPILTTNSFGSKLILERETTSNSYYVRLISGAAITRSTSTAPNATVPVTSFEAVGSQTNIDLAIVPKGTGAILAAIPDNATAGGNKRGINAVDLQTSRTLATQVASGNYSVIPGGLNNTASGLYGYAGGVSCSATGESSFAFGSSNNSSNLATTAIGNSNLASGTTAVAIGNSNTANATAAVAIGSSNVASGQFSTVFGRSGSSRVLSGAVVFGFQGTVIGQNQLLIWGGRQTTTGVSPLRITSDAASGAATNQLALANNQAAYFEGYVVARDTVTGDTKQWRITGLIKRGANAAATALVGVPTVTSAFADTAASSWSIALAADTTNGALAVTATGAGTNAIRWSAHILSSEVA